VNLVDVGEFNGRRLYNKFRLDYRRRLWAPTSASRAISAVAELLVLNVSCSLDTWETLSANVYCLGSVLREYGYRNNRRKATRR